MKVKGMRIYYPDIQVECYAGYRGEEEPRRFVFNKRQLEVAEIIDRWLDPRHRYFKVRTTEVGYYMLRHDTNSGRWELALLSHPRTPLDE